MQPEVWIKNDADLEKTKPLISRSCEESLKSGFFNQIVHFLPESHAEVRGVRISQIFQVILKLFLQRHAKQSSIQSVPATFRRNQLVFGLIAPNHPSSSFSF